jgi:hypothetical protein
LVLFFFFIFYRKSLSEAVAQAVKTHKSHTAVAKGASARRGVVSAAVSPCPLAKIVLRRAVFVVIGIHRASSVKISLRVHIKSASYRNTALKEVPLCVSVALVNLVEYVFRLNVVAVVKQTANLCIFGIAA